MAIIGGILGIAAAGIAVWMRSGGASGSAGVQRLKDNILLVTLDTLRADRLGSYGYTRARTRHLDKLASEGVRFEWAFSPAPITLPAHASILTGLYPFEHGVRNNGNFYLADRFETLPAVLAAQGYRTAAFVSSFVLDRRYGLARGFERYDDRMQGGQSQVVSLEAERRGDRTALALSGWLDEYAAGSSAGGSSSTRPPFFAWLHLYDPHEPYRAPPPFGPAFADSPYDGEVAFTDAIVASILDKLSALGLLSNTIVAVIGDHGESLGDHGEETHSMFVYDSAVRVPLLLWRPGRLPAGLVVRQPVRAIDLPWTLADLVGVPSPAPPHGRSLMPLIERPAGQPSEPVYAETYLPELYMNWAPLRALRDDRWKFIDAPRPELYDLETDPGEQQNLYDREPQTAAAIRRALERLAGNASQPIKGATLDRETLDKLAALGYVGAGAERPPRTAGQPLADPKDMIGVFNRLRRANSAVRDRRFADALPVLQDVLREDPKNAFATLVLGSAYMGMEEYTRAIQQYQRYLQLVPTSAYAHQWIAICHIRLGQQDLALKEADAALAIDSRFSDARVLRAGILASRGNHDAAIAELQQAVALDPAKPMIRLDLAKVLDEAGRQDEAQREFETILKAQADYVPALTGLGALLAKRGRHADAEAVLRRSLALEPVQDSGRFNLARVLEQQRRNAEAAAEYRRLADAPTTAPAVKAAARARLAVIGK
ncbi:MAG TPA: sulfatase-like hydrolase/transferase [Vicinamibacterales bacterium]|nr:sulfatase-like hydrolase/transferase [Vicinamibacterales bacterium]